MTRDLTDAERDVISLLGQAASRAAELPRVHDSDAPEFYQFIHGCQNIIYARPAYESEKSRWSQ